MVEVLEDLQPLRHDGVRLVALDVGDEADAAGVVLGGGVVQAALGEGVDLIAGRRPGSSRGHGALHLNSGKGPEAYRSAAFAARPNKWGRSRIYRH